MYVSTPGAVVLGILGFVLGAAFLLVSYCIWPSFFSRIFGQTFLHRSRSFESPIIGYWYSVFWRRTRSGEIRQHAHILHVSRFQNYYHAIVVKGDYHHFRLSGILFRGQFVTGVWHNDDKKRAYQGSFQLRLHNDGEIFTGKWLGWNQDEAINAGLWAMVKLSSDDLETVEINPRRPTFREFDTVDRSMLRRRLDRVLLSERGKDRSLGWPDA